MKRIDMTVDYKMSGVHLQMLMMYADHLGQLGQLGQGQINSGRLFEISNQIDFIVEKAEQLEEVDDD